KGGHLTEHRLDRDRRLIRHDPRKCSLRVLAGPGHLHRTARRRAHGWIVVRFVSSLRYEFRGVPMSWTVEGTYFENCNCDFACPCTITSFASPGTERSEERRVGKAERAGWP